MPNYTNDELFSMHHVAEEVGYYKSIYTELTSEDLTFETHLSDHVLKKPSIDEHGLKQDLMCPLAKGMISKIRMLARSSSENKIEFPYNDLTKKLKIKKFHIGRELKRSISEVKDLSWVNEITLNKKSKTIKVSYNDEIFNISYQGIVIVPAHYNTDRKFVNSYILNKTKVFTNIEEVQTSLQLLKEEIKAKDWRLEMNTRANLRSHKQKLHREKIRKKGNKDE